MIIETDKIYLNQKKKLKLILHYDFESTRDQFCDSENLTFQRIVNDNLVLEQTKFQAMFFFNGYINLLRCGLF